MRDREKTSFAQLQAELLHKNRLTFFNAFFKLLQALCLSPTPTCGAEWGIAKLNVLVLHETLTQCLRYFFSIAADLQQRLTLHAPARLEALHRQRLGKNAAAFAQLFTDAAQRPRGAEALTHLYLPDPYATQTASDAELLRALRSRCAFHPDFQPSHSFFWRAAPRPATRDLSAEQNASWLESAATVSEDQSREPVPSVVDRLYLHT